MGQGAFTVKRTLWALLVLAVLVMGHLGVARRHTVAKKGYGSPGTVGDHPSHLTMWILSPSVIIPVERYYSDRLSPTVR